MCEPVTIGIACVVCCCCVVGIAIFMAMAAQTLMPLVNASFEAFLCMNQTTYEQLDTLASNNDKLASCVEKVEENMEACNDYEGEFPQTCKDINNECGCKITVGVTKLTNPPFAQSYNDCCDEFKNIEGVFASHAEEIFDWCLEAMQNLTDSVDDLAKSCEAGQDPFKNSTMFMFPETTADKNPDADNAPGAFRRMEQRFQQKFAASRLVAHGVIGAGVPGATHWSGAAVGVAVTAGLLLFAARAWRGRRQSPSSTFEPLVDAPVAVLREKEAQE